MYFQGLHIVGHGFKPWACRVESALEASEQKRLSHPFSRIGI
jgi:hypothetical protein